MFNTNAELLANYRNGVRATNQTVRRLAEERAAFRERRLNPIVHRLPKGVDKNERMRLVRLAQMGFEYDDDLSTWIPNADGREFVIRRQAI